MKFVQVHLASLKKQNQTIESRGKISNAKLAVTVLVSASTICYWHMGNDNCFKLSAIGHQSVTAYSETRLLL